MTMPCKDRTVRLERQRAYAATNRDALMAANRSRAARRWGLLEFRHVETPSEHLFGEMWASANINVFLQQPDKIAKWGHTLPDSLQEEIFLFGVAAVLRVLRRHATAASAAALVRAAETSKREGSSRIRAMAERSKQFSRIVEMLDSHSIGGKLLGDCTKGDLLRAAAEAESVAAGATMNAQFYRLLAAMLPEHGVTVRQANNRKEIVGLLTTTFREPT